MLQAGGLVTALAALATDARVATFAAARTAAGHALVTLAPGLERTEEFVAAGRLLTDVAGTLPVSVLSTPGMIAMMERCAAVLAFEHLGDGGGTVGFEVCARVTDGR